MTMQLGEDFTIEGRHTPAKDVPALVRKFELAMGRCMLNPKEFGKLDLGLIAAVVQALKDHAMPTAVVINTTPTKKP